MTVAPIVQLINWKCLVRPKRHYKEKTLEGKNVSNTPWRGCKYAIRYKLFYYVYGENIKLLIVSENHWMESLCYVFLLSVRISHCLTVRGWGEGGGRRERENQAKGDKEGGNRLVNLLWTQMAYTTYKSIVNFTKFHIRNYCFRYI